MYDPMYGLLNRALMSYWEESNKYIEQLLINYKLNKEINKLKKKIKGEKNESRTIK